MVAATLGFLRGAGSAEASHHARAAHARQPERQRRRARPRGPPRRLRRRQPGCDERTRRPGQGRARLGQGAGFRLPDRMRPARRRRWPGRCAVAAPGGADELGDATAACAGGVPAARRDAAEPAARAQRGAGLAGAVDAALHAPRRAHRHRRAGGGRARRRSARVQCADAHAAGPTLGLALRHAMEDAWTHPMVNRRWQRLALHLSEADARAAASDGYAGSRPGWLGAKPPVKAAAAPTIAAWPPRTSTPSCSVPALPARR